MSFAATANCPVAQLSANLRPPAVLPELAEDVAATMPRSRRWCRAARTARTGSETTEASSSQTLAASDAKGDAPPADAVAGCPPQPCGDATAFELPDSVPGEKARQAASEDADGDTSAGSGNSDGGSDDEASTTDAEICADSGRCCVASEAASDDEKVPVSMKSNAPAFKPASSGKVVLLLGPLLP
eukprot:CAMPEP_0168444144 /NCGR_PEP_ID=MMETSP0228-20121227/44895_1 /TAXON_ID=133427 /ORGANISM="Protoceratium reticulatum, Strain CCCM 535 (=CCMP 1889)" /LENGTH=185 /DNA_ID=CAMNT_0008458573 /DNA_START=82 /DNA_END=636 /DNA_ORIENTATION=-